MPYKRKEDKAAQMREYRKREKDKQDTRDALTEAYEKALNYFQETIDENKILKDNIKILKAGREKTHLIACNPSLTNKEKVSLILDTPDHISLKAHLNKLEKLRLKVKKNE